MTKIPLNFAFILSVLLINSFVNSAPRWDDHGPIDTLRLLQIVHRHGERTVLFGNMAKRTDPFINITNWPEGFGQLTGPGKARMYQMGANLRQWYDGYLSKDHSPRRVYARSSIEHRCIESVSCLLSGMYIPTGSWQWDTNDLAKIWQPFPIETFMPKDEDTVLVPHKPCPKAQNEYKKISDSAEVKAIVKQLKDKPIYNFMRSELFQEPIDSLYRGQQFWDTLKIEKETGKLWPQLKEMNSSAPYSQDEVIKALEPLGLGSYVYDWFTKFTLKIRLGKLIEILIANMKSVIDGKNLDDKKELYVYSTHDSIVVPLMQAFGPYNNQTPPYGGGLLIELHEHTTNNYSVQIYYYNETDKQPVPFLGVGLGKLSFDQFKSDNQKWLYWDFDKECGLTSEDKPNLILSEMTFMVIGMAIGIGLLGLNIFAFKYLRARKNTFRVTK